MDLTELIKQIDLKSLAERAGAHFEHHNGHGFSSTCPLHSGSDNKTAFHIYSDGDGKQHWTCFTRCQASGDALDFYQRWKGISDVGEAAKELAAEYHLDLDWKTDPARVEAERVRRLRMDVLDEARRYFTAELWKPEAAHALEYVRSRGFTDEDIRASGWGFSNSGTGLYQHLVTHGFSVDLAKEIGVVRFDGTDYTDHRAGPFGWITYPHQVNGRTVYFSSRAVEVEGKERPDPKDKCRNITGHRQPYRADLTGQAAGQVIIVEGPADAESIRAMGVASAWALCGLGSLDPEDIEALQKRRVVYISTDSDQVGRDQLTKIESPLVKMIDELGPLAMILSPLETKDFNAWYSNELEPVRSEAIRRLMEGAETWLEHRVELARCCSPAEADERMMEIGKLLSQLPETTRPRFFKITQDKLKIGRKDIQELIGTANGKDTGKILSSVKDGQISFLGRPLGNFHCKITHELTIDDGENQPTVRYTVTGKMASGPPLGQIDIDAGDFAGMNWLARYWGARPIIYVGKGSYHELARAIQEISEGMQRERVYTFTGWARIADQLSFLSASGRIHAEGIDQETRVDLGVNNMRYYELPEPVTGSELFKAVKASLDFLHLGSRAVTGPLWAAMYAAPLTGMAPLYALIWVYGTTQSGKSTIAHLALTHFGAGFIQGRQYHAPIDWMSTPTSIEGACFAAKDVPLVIDDFAPQFASVSDAKEMHRKAHYIVRSVGNRSSRGRSQANLKERQTRVPRGLVISTAENPLVGQSTVGRMIYIQVARGDILPVDGSNNPLLDAAQKAGQEGQYAQAMTAFLQYLAANWDAVKTHFLARVEATAAALRAEKPQLQSRLPDYYAILTEASGLVLAVFNKLGFISEHEATVEYEANRDAIKEIICQQAELIAAESPVRKFFEALASLLERRRVFLAPKSLGKIEYIPPDRSELIGWFDDDGKTVYIPCNESLSKAKDFWHGLDENLDILPDALRHQISQIPGLLGQRDKDGHIECAVRCSGKIRRVMVINIERVMELYGVSVTNEASNTDNVEIP